jgi:predicted lipoprotein
MRPSTIMQPRVSSAAAIASALAIVGLGGCGSPQRTLARALEQSASSSATMRFVIETWSDRRVPHRYATRTAREIARSSEQTAASVAGSSAAPADRETAARLTGAIAAAAARGAAAIEAGDRAGARTVLPALDSLRAAARSASDALEARP